VARPKRAHLRRLVILAAGVEAIGARGLENTRLSDIAKRAGTTPSNVLYYFSSREELLEEALILADERFFAALSTRLEAHPSAVDRLALAIHDSVWSYDWGLWVELHAAALRRPRTRATVARFNRDWLNVLTEIIRLGQEQDEFADVDAEETAIAVAALIDGLAAQVIVSDPAIPRERVERICLAFASDRLGCDFGESETEGPSTRIGRLGM
jgi:AcrR family transcriptional regulator